MKSILQKIKNRLKASPQFVKSWLIILNYADFIRLIFSMLLKGGKNIILKPKDLRYPIEIRGHQIDRSVLHSIMYSKYHLPPIGFQMPDNPTILDLGSNIGITIADYKSMYPNSNVVGYEMDTENFVLAQRNIQHYEGVSLYNEAIWIENTILEYSKDVNYDAYKVNDKVNADVLQGNVVQVKGVTMDSVIEKNKIVEIDFLKMDIEGAEKEIFLAEDLKWMSRVRSMNVEIHLTEDENIDTFIDIIAKQGFNVWKDTNHWSCIMAIRKNC